MTIPRAAAPAREDEGNGERGAGRSIGRGKMTGRIGRLPGTALLLAGALLFAAGCGDDNPASSGGNGFDAGGAAAALDSVADAAIAGENIVNAVFLVDLPGEDFTWAAARGLADPGAGDSMTVETPFRIASVSKTFTAALVLDLVEEGLIGLDDSLGAILDSTIFPAGYGPPDLHVRGGEKSGGALTVRGLLNHSSGARSYIFDDLTGTDGAPGSLIFDYIEDVVTTGASGIASTQWTPEGLLEFYLTSGLAGAALFAPGDGHHYSDTNYLLLGHVVEAATGNDFVDELRGRILDPLGLTDTYLEWFEPAAGDGPAHHFIDLRIIGGPNADIVALGVNTSLDWAGGGMVSTAGDLARFVRELTAGRLFERASTLDAMYGWTDAGGGAYGLGIRRFSSAGRTVIGHGGFWGIQIAYLPEMDGVIVFALNQVDADGGEVLRGVIEALAKAGA